MSLLKNIYNILFSDKDDLSSMQDSSPAIVTVNSFIRQLSESSGEGIIGINKEANIHQQGLWYKDKNEWKESVPIGNIGPSKCLLRLLVITRIDHWKKGIQNGSLFISIWNADGVEKKYSIKVQYNSEESSAYINLEPQN